MKVSNIKKMLKFAVEEKRIIEELNIPKESFLPLIFSIRFGGDWSVVKNSESSIAVKEKVTRYDENKKIGYTLEKIYLFLNPKILSKEGTVYRLEKCGNEKERKLVKRPYKITIDGKTIIKAELDPMSNEIRIKKLRGPLTFKGPVAYGISHEMEHLKPSKEEEKYFWEFKWNLLTDAKNKSFI
nr:RimK/LysX family protein [Methanothermus fervidus]